jgi:hypothetical protein
MGTIIAAVVGAALKALLAPLIGWLTMAYQNRQVATAAADQTAVAVSDANAKAQAAVAQAEASAPSTTKASEAAMDAGTF